MLKLSKHLEKRQQFSLSSIQQEFYAWFVDLQLIKGLDDYVRACTMFSDQH